MEYGNFKNPPSRQDANPVVSPPYYGNQWNQQLDNSNSMAAATSAAHSTTTSSETLPYAETTARMTAPATAVPAVAAAPKCETLYESLLRYHEENDSQDEEEEIKGGRKKRTGQQYDNDDDRKLPASSFGGDDRKPAAKPAAAGAKKPPPQSSTSTGGGVQLESARQNLATRSVSDKANTKARPEPPTRHFSSDGLRDSSSHHSPRESMISMTNDLWNNDEVPMSSFYKAALEQTRLMGDDSGTDLSFQHDMHDLVVPGASQVPGVVRVNQPVALPDSAMYRRAYGDVRSTNRTTTTATTTTTTTTATATRPELGPRRTSLNEYTGGHNRDIDDVRNGLSSYSASAHGRLDLATSTGGGGSAAGVAGGMYPNMHETRAAIDSLPERNEPPPPTRLKRRSFVDDESETSFSEEPMVVAIRNNVSDNKRLGQAPSATSIRPWGANVGGTGGGLSKSNHVGSDFYKNRQTDRARSPKRSSSANITPYTGSPDTRKPSPTRSAHARTTFNRNMSPTNSPKIGRAGTYNSNQQSNQRTQSRSPVMQNVSGGGNQKLSVSHHEMSPTRNRKSRSPVRHSIVSSPTRERYGTYSNNSPSRNMSADQIPNFAGLACSPLGGGNGYDNRITAQSMDAIGQEFNSPRSSRPAPRRPAPPPPPPPPALAVTPKAVTPKPAPPRSDLAATTRTARPAVPAVEPTRFSEPDEDVLLALQISKQEAEQNEARANGQLMQNYQQESFSGRQPIQGSGGPSSVAGSSSSVGVGTNSGGSYGGISSTYPASVMSGSSSNNHSVYPTNAIDDASNNNIEDVMLALKLSEEVEREERVATNLDELLAMEMQRGESGGIGLPPSGGNDGAVSDHDVAAMSIAATADHTAPTSTNATTTTNNQSSSEADEQFRILKQIREEQERRDIELALKVSREQSLDEDALLGGIGGGIGNSSGVGMGLHQHSQVYDGSTTSLNGGFGVDEHAGSVGKAQDFLLSQQMAMEEFSNRSGRTTATTFNTSGSDSSSWQQQQQQQQQPPPQQQQDPMSQQLRQRVVQEGTMETQNAISSGQAHIVTCKGCNGRLQAPISYSLVFCPKCQTISPA